MKTVKIITISIILLFLTQGIKAQKVWTLEDCIDYAIENNIDVKRQELVAKQSKNTFEQSKYNLLPDFNGFVNHNVNSGKSINYETYSYVTENYNNGSMGINSNLDLFKGLQLYNSIKKNNLDLKANLKNVEKAKNDLSLNIATAYMQILFNIELEKVSKKELEMTEEQIEKTQKLVDVGNISKSDLLEIRAQAASEKVNLTNAKNQLILSYLNLTQMLNLDSIGNFEIKIPSEIVIGNNKSVKNVNFIYNEALDFMPQIKSAEYQLQSSKKSLDITKGQLSPSLSLGFVYYTRYNELSKPIFTYNEQIRENSYKQLTLSLNIPIFNKMQVKNNISNAKINILDARLSLNQTKQGLYKAIQQASIESIAAFEKFQANEDAVESMNEAFNYTQQKYQVGIVDIVEYKL
ncbi:MAG: TolC family protein, partial [Bacteroidota bacterium]|nr:TolC family protein [Bacteroidota bacterium]